ncbi:hypothetical protein FNF27_04276 [Cafeteria roenbergensis]|uniref:Suppressor of forked domain-containing protein n=3 Tax=Cafeteria roenbergensis TaxID=33653 RepID=A0A5A8EAL5_CAFRO|nr:hypothetical protein FNF27_04276 [Cafeteria roenbergensis]
MSATQSEAARGALPEGSAAAEAAANPLAGSGVIPEKPQVVQQRRETTKKLQARVEQEPDDVESWSQLLRALRQSPDEARTAYESFLKRFPTATRFILDFAKMEFGAGEMARAKTLLGKTLRLNPDPELWQFYVDFVRSSKLVPALKRLSAAKTAAQAKGAAASAAKEEEAASAAVEAARSAVSKAFEYAVGKVGLLPGADGLWDAWLQFLRSMPSETEFEVEQRRQALRSALQRSCAAPIARVASAELWAEYEAFEKDNAQATLAASLLAKHKPAFVTASAVARERAALWAAINPHVVPVQPPQDRASSSGPAARGFALVLQQLPGWRALLAYEERNPLRLDAEQHASLMRSHLQRCLLSTRSAPHFWMELARSELRIAGVLGPSEPIFAVADKPDAMASAAGAAARSAALKVLTEGCKAAPRSEALAMATADIAELLGQPKTAVDVYEQAAKGRPSASLLVAWLRFTRRHAGATAARHVLASARKICSHPALFLAAADMEATCNAEPATALKLLDLGRRHLATEASKGGPGATRAFVDFAVAACSMACRFADAANARSLLEAFVGDVPPRSWGPLMAVYLDFEARGADGGGDIRRLARLEMRCLRESGALPGAASWGGPDGVAGGASLAAHAYRWQCFGLPPADGAADAAVFTQGAPPPLAFRTADGGCRFGEEAAAAASAALGVEPAAAPAPRASLLAHGAPAAPAAASVPMHPSAGGPAAAAAAVSGGPLLAATSAGPASNGPAAVSGTAASSAAAPAISAAALSGRVIPSVALSAHAPPSSTSAAFAPPASRMLDGQVAAPTPQPSVPVHPSLLRKAAKVAERQAEASGSSAGSAAAAAAEQDPAPVQVSDPVPALLKEATPRGRILGPALTRLCVAVASSSAQPLPALAAKQLVTDIRYIAVPPSILAEAASDERLMQAAYVGGVGRFMHLAEAFVSHPGEDIEAEVAAAQAGNGAQPKQELGAPAAKRPRDESDPDADQAAPSAQRIKPEPSDA